jgi:nucleoside-diphosphate-sugar epimerase
MAQGSTVLVTGSAGRIGRAVVAELQARGRAVRGFDVVPTPGLADSVAGSVADEAAVRRAMDGVDAVVHLAATPDDDDFLTRLLPNNVVGVYQVFEAARAAGVRRLVLASSGQVVWWRRIRGPWPVTADGPVTPRGWYAATKVFQEAAGRAFAEMFDMTVIVARLGWCPRTVEQVQEIARTDWAPDLYLSPADAGRFFARAVEAPLDVRFVIAYPTSRPVRAPIYDPAPGRDLLGFEPQDTWPQGVEDMLEEGRREQGKTGFRV